MPGDRCTGPVPRREFLQIGRLAPGGVALPQILAGRATAGQQNRDTSVILLYLHGGPSQLETYDLKPDAPTDYRSIFNSIPTSVPGMDICELLPLQAKLGDRIALVRFLHHEMSSHSDGGIEVLTGKTPAVPDPASQSKSEHPDIGSVVSHVRGTSGSAIPPYVAVPRATYMTRPTYLGLQHSPLVCGDPSRDNYRAPVASLNTGVNGSRLGDRRSLLGQLDAFRSAVDLHDSIDAADEFTQLAFQVLTSPPWFSEPGRTPEKTREFPGVSSLADSPFPTISVAFMDKSWTKSFLSIHARSRPSPSVAASTSSASVRL